MNAYIDSTQLWLPPLPPDPNTPKLTAELRPNASKMPLFNTDMPIADWASTQLNFHPDPVQTEIFNAATHRLILCCTRQWGKSSIAAIKALHLALRKPGALILFTSASYKQSAELLRKFRGYATQLTGTKCKGDGIHPGSTVLPNGSRILALPQSPATVRCYSAVDLIVIDEAAFVIDEMHAALTPMLATSDGDLWLLSSPNGRTGEFHKIWTANEPGWHKFSVNALECPRIKPEFLERERRAKGLAIFNQEYMCQFASAKNQTIEQHHIDAAFRGDYPAMNFPK